MKPHLCLLGDANSVHVQRWAREMLARGLRVSVVTARPAAINGVAEQIVLPPVQRPSDWLWRVGAAQRALNRLAPDLVHAHYITSYGYLAARCTQRPLVMTAWGSDLLVTPKGRPLMRALTGWTLRRADLVTGDSTDLLHEIASYRPRAAPLLVHWGVELSRFAPTPWADKPRLEIVSLRNWEPNYRIAVIVQALAELRRRLPGAPLHLHLLGGGPLVEALAQQVRAAGLQGAVTLHGRLADAGMAAVLARCKVSVSVPLSDATSVSVLESMACGLAVVASDLPANRHWLGSEPDLLLTGDSDATLARALADALERLWHDDARAQRVGQANHARMRAEGSREVQMDRMFAQYQRLLAEADG
ncbi:MAG: glycosyltransferase [Rubrivivax sp.]|nr:glycosyltransferase [Rubrivivax sp.]